MQLSRRARYKLVEGIDGMGKTTQCDRHVASRRAKGIRVCYTREIGSPHLPDTGPLMREWMLQPRYDENPALLRSEILTLMDDDEKKEGTLLTRNARIFLRIVVAGEHTDKMRPFERELISQAIRSIHYEQVIKPALWSGDYDEIVQDRGVPSGFGYGWSRGNDAVWLRDLTLTVTGYGPGATLETLAADLYDDIIYLHGDIAAGLRRSAAARGGAAADVIEKDGVPGMTKVVEGFDKVLPVFRDAMGARFTSIWVEDKSIEDVGQLIETALA